MNKQQSIDPAISHGTSNQRQRKGRIAFIVAFLLINFLLFATAAWAQSSAVTIGANDDLTVSCDGRGFQLERVSNAHVRLTCVAGNPPPGQPTAAPPEPTTVPPEPTAVPPEPTAVPPEPTAAPTDEPGPQPPFGGSPSCDTTTGFIPLNDLGTGLYNGYMGGLYPNGANVAPAAHMARALTAASNINPNETFVLLSIGMSNAMREFEVFADVTAADPAANPNMILINGAQTGQDAVDISDPNADYWDGVNRKLTNIRLTPEQVRVVWLKETHSYPEGVFPTEAATLQANLESIVRILDDRFPNLELIYLASRIYAGYTDSDLSPEPYAYESGFAVKWLIESQINGSLEIDPVLVWGPYLWADGQNARSDGLTWVCDDYRNDMIHPDDQGSLKVANMLLDFFKSDSTTRWFVGETVTN